jgi:hypothetical protein
MRAAFSRHALFAVLLLAIVSLPSRSMCRDIMDEEDSPETNNKPPDSVYWQCEVPHGGPAIPPDRILAGRHSLTYLRIDDTKTPEVGTLSTSFDRRFVAGGGAHEHAAVCFSYRLTVGDVLPMLDAMYKVIELRVENSVRLKRVTDKEFVKNLADDRNLIVIPVGTRASFLFLHNSSERPVDAIVGVDKIAVANRKPEAPKARLSVYLDPGTPHAPAPVLKTIDASVGTVVDLVKGCQLTVKKIVPPDEKHKILGWVEFSPNPPKQKQAAEER